MFSSKRRLLWLTGTMAMTAALLAADVAPNLNAAKSSIVATYKQEGVTVDAPFKTFIGRVVYDAADTTGSSAVISVDMASLDIGDDSYNAEVRKKPWFDSAAYPKATFTASSIKATTPNHLVATGALVIKGRASTITVPVTVTPTAGVTSFSGALVISRKTYGIGDPIWDDVIDDKVSIKFQLVTAGR
jgi:polyisoprenoid-binding protein YceI